ncbi:50S ribosomal protein L3 [Bienertia sinuspersici]
MQRRIDNGLTELPVHGPAFTWCNNREGGELIYEQLDRAYCNECWRDLFPEACIINHEILASDHGAILLETSPRRLKRKRPYKLEAWRQEAVAKDCRSWCIERKKRLGITWDLSKEELEPLQAIIKNREEGDSEISKRLVCQEKQSCSFYTGNKERKLRGIRLEISAQDFSFRVLR